MDVVAQQKILISGVTVIILLLMPALFIAADSEETPLASPPEGFGAVTQGGEGGKTIVVTNLSDSGPGSLREALAAQEPRTIEFAVEGVIELESRIRVTSGQVTIDGSTALGNGITIMPSIIINRIGAPKP